jgi:hypothetical protein
MQRDQLTRAGAAYGIGSVEKVSPSDGRLIKLKIYVVSGKIE